MEPKFDSFHATVAEAAGIDTRAQDIVIEELSGGLPRLPEEATSDEIAAAFEKVAAEQAAAEQVAAAGKQQPTDIQIDARAHDTVKHIEGGLEAEAAAALVAKPATTTGTEGFMPRPRE